MTINSWPNKDGVQNQSGKFNQGNVVREEINYPPAYERNISGWKPSFVEE